MKKLNEEEIEYIKKQFDFSQLNYYEVYQEILDHMIESTQIILEEQPTITLKDAVTQARLEFGAYNFKQMEQERLQIQRKAVNREAWIHYKNYWTWPKFVGSVGLLILIYISLHFIEIKWIMANVAVIFLLAIIYNIFKTYKYWKKEGKKMLIIEQIKSYTVFFVLYSSIFNVLTNLGLLGQIWNYENPLVVIFFSLLICSSLIHVHIFIKIHSRLMPKIKSLYYAK